MERAVVLAGGGVAGIAWELGVLRGIGDVDAGLLAGIVAADVVVGTSAGSAVAAQITSGAAIEDLYAAQLAESSSEIDIELDLEDLLVRFAAAVGGASGPEDARRRIGTLALETPTVTEAARRAAIAARLPDPSWPDRTLLVTAVEALTGDLTVFNRESGVELVDAVAASCAVPGVWPPVTIDGIRYIDGGVRSGSNADLAAGCDRVLVITPSRPDVRPAVGQPGRRDPDAATGGRPRRLRRRRLDGRVRDQPARTGHPPAGGPGRSGRGSGRSGEGRLFRELTTHPGPSRARGDRRRRRT